MFHHRPDIALESPWERLRVHDDVKVSGRFGVGDTDGLSGPCQNLARKRASRKYRYVDDSRDAELPFPISGSRLTKRPGGLRVRAKDSRPRSGQKLGSNMHKTDSLPKESETSFVKIVRGGSRGIRPGQAEKKGREFQKP